MQLHILQTKLKPPRIAPDILPRARLLDMLNEGRRRTLTLISASAGYGKSTLAYRWVTGSDFPSGWVSLDESDSDLPVFLSYFLAAVQSLFPKTELSTEVFLESYQKPPVNVLARYLLNDLDQISEPFILVLDDYQHISGSSSVHDLLREVLAHPPRTMHLALLTRRDPPFSISKLRGNGQVTEIRASDLRFTPAEVSAFFNEKLKIPLDDATARLLDEKMEGWVTGLRLAGLYLHDQDDLKNRVQELSGGLSNIAEYLIEEVLSKQNPEISAFLVESSILNRFCAPLCQAVHSRGVEERNEEQDFDAQRFIKQLVDANLFVIPLDDEDQWFRYHHLFQGFLQGLLRKQSNEDAIAGLHLRASNWFAENGLIDEAIRHALDAGDSEAAVRLVVDHRYDLLNTSQFHRLGGWLRMLPEGAAAESPLLMTTRAFIGLVFGPDSDLFTYTELARRKAVEIPAESPDASMLHGEIAVIQNVMDILSGHTATVSANAEKALQLLPKQAMFSRSLAVSNLIYLLNTEGDRTRSLKQLCDSLIDPEWPTSIQIRMSMYLCFIAFMDADSSSVQFSARECLRAIGSAPLIQPKSNAQYYLGAVHYLRNELAEAKSYLTDVMRNRDASEAAFVVHAGGILGFIHLAEGCPEETKHIMESVATNSWQMQDYALATRDALLVEFALRQRRGDEARRLSVGLDFDLRPPHWFLYVPQLTLLKLLLAESTEKSLREAHSRLTELNERMSRINRRNVRIDVLALLALVCRQLGDEDSALKHLQSALDLAQAGGWIRNFVDLGAPMTALLERQVQLQPAHNFARQVLDACRADAAGQPALDRAAEKTSSTAAQAAAPILSNREIDILHLLAEGFTNKEIASKLFISAETVKTHLQNIYRKLDAKGGRVAALKTARTLGIIAPD